MDEQPEWFAAKRWGYGAGIPISWQGWAATIAYFAIIALILTTLRDRPLAIVAAIIVPTIAFVAIAARTTRGGWRWRWGRDD